MNDKIFQKLHTKQMSHLFRRVAAAVVAISMILPATTMAAGAFPMYMEEPIKMKEGEAPTITIESNAVVDRWYDPEGPESAADYLTGELEVVIRAKSGCVVGEGGSEEWQGFNTLGVALKYSPLLEPYQWTDGEKAIDLTGTSVFDEMTNQQTLKDKNVTTAMAQVSGETGKGGYLYFNVEANRPIVLKEDTVLAVVTFRYDLETVGPILAEDAAQWLTPVKSDDSTGGGTGDGGDAGTEGGETTRTATDCLIQFATVADLEDHSQLCELVYNSAYGENFDHFNTMYYSDPASGVGVEAKDPADGSVSIDYNRLDLSVDYDNVEEHKVNFSLVNKPSYNDGGLSLDDLATVLFYDWDDTLVGVLTVPRDGDARQIVNAYIHDNLIHPDLRDNTNYSSLSRSDNYRGKYPSSGPMADGATDGTEVTDGDKYLTGKLDYVLLKRPMEQAVTTGDDGEETLVADQWKQKSTVGEDGTETAVWDDKYPYIHGWAIVDYSHPENTWTTIGVGELLDYSGALSSGYKELNGAPAQLTVSGQQFEFANFDFRRTNSLEPGSVYAVKAVYEPGVDLMASGYQYRMISEPYYNKLNNTAAASGGAYSVDVVFERATVNVGVVRGVARARELAIDQETTADIRWEDKGLTNATTDEQNAKAKTTYSRVVVDNVDEVNIQLVLSGRFNKVDYYLIEAYKASFVTGGSRSAANSTFTGTAHVIDNYNYKVPDSDLADAYYDSLYIGAEEDRNGSHGFVLYGTLNNLLKIATQYIRNEIGVSEFNNYFSLANFQDINLRLPNQNFATSADERDNMRAAIRAATQAAIDAHNAGDDTWWNAEHDWAELTYHQLQLYVLDYLEGRTPTLAQPDANEAAPAEFINWCNLHEACAAKRSGKPTSFDAMIQAALGTQEQQDSIKLLDISTALGYIYLRDENGEEYTTITDFADDFIEAVRGINAINSTYVKDWDALQGWILSGGGKPSSVAAAQQASKDGAWWYDDTVGGGSPTATPPAMNLTGILDAAEKANGLGRDAWLNEFKEAYDSAFVQTPANVTDWVRYTGNLMATCDVSGITPSYDITTFASFDAFKTAVKNVQANLTVDENWNASELWHEVQYYIINGTASTGSTADIEQMNNYWWYNGGTRVTDVASLLENARDNTDTWKAFTFTDLYKYPALSFAKDFAGTQYVAADFSDFKTTIQAMAATSTNYTWEQVQYYLIHGVVRAGSTVTNESAYYWWKDGGTGSSVDFSGVNSYSTGLAAFLEAAFRYEINGNTHAWDNLTTDIIKVARLIAADNGATTFDTLGHFANESDFVAAMNGLAAAAGAVAPGNDGAGNDWSMTMPTASWEQVQYYLLNNKTFADNDTVAQENYWWKTLDDLGSQKTPQEMFDELLAAYQDYIDNGDITAVETWVSDPNNLNGVFINPNDPDNGFTQDDADGLIGWGLWERIIDEGGFTDSTEISWYQIEGLIADGWYMGMDDNDEYDNLVNNWGLTIPDWVPAPAALFGVHPMMAARRPVTTVETNEGTGVTTVTTVTKTEVGENILTVTTVTTIDPITGEVTTVTTTKLTDEEGNTLSESATVTTTPTETPEEPEETTEPTDPELPTEPVGPEIPAVPGETTDPTESETPVEPVEPTEPETPTEPVEPEEPDFVDPPEESEHPEEKPPMTEGTDPETLEPSKELPKEDSTEPEGPEDVQPSEETAEGGADMMENESLTAFDVMTTAYRQQLTTKFNNLNRLRLRTLLEPLKLSGMNVSRWSGPGTLGPPTQNVSRLSLDLSYIFTVGRITT